VVGVTVLVEVAFGDGVGEVVRGVSISAGTAAQAPRRREKTIAGKSGMSFINVFFADALAPELVPILDGRPGPLLQAYRRILPGDTIIVFLPVSPVAHPQVEHVKLLKLNEGRSHPL